MKNKLKIDFERTLEGTIRYIIIHKHLEVGNIFYIEEEKNIYLEIFFDTEIGRKIYKIKPSKFYKLIEDVIYHKFIFHNDLPNLLKYEIVLYTYGNLKILETGKIKVEIRKNRSSIVEEVEIIPNK